MTDAELFEQFSIYQQGMAFSVHTIRRRRLALGRFARHMAPASVLTAKAADLDQWLSKLRSVRTKHAYQSDVKNFFRWAHSRGVIDVDPLAHTRNVRVPKAVPSPAPAEIIAAAFAIAQPDVQLALMLGALAGLRVSEIVGLDAADVHLDADPPILIVRGGKGGESRVIPLHPTLQTMLEGRTGWLFPHRNAGYSGPLRAQTLAVRIADTLTTAAGGRRITTHKLRHYFGTETARWAKGNMVLVASLMGHSSMDTTLGYVGWTPTEGAEVVAKMTLAVDDELARRRQQRAG
jgi:integrase/recombinase XerC